MEKLIEQYKPLRYKYIRKAIQIIPSLENFVEDINHDFIIAQIKSWENRNKDIVDFEPYKYFNKVFYYEYLKVLKGNFKYHNDSYAYSALINCCLDNKYLNTIPFSYYNMDEYLINDEIKNIIDGIKFQKHGNVKEQLIDYFINMMDVSDICKKYKKQWSTVDENIKTYGKKIWRIYNKKSNR